jgi:hypothetical protein
MTAQTIAPAERISSDSVLQLAIIEARRSLRRVSIWAGFVFTIVIIASPTTADWPGGSYSEKLPQSFMPIVLGTFIAAFRTGRRDGQDDVSESAAVGPDHRALARLASLVLPVLLTVLVAVGFAIASRIEGGFWLGEHPRRTDTALHPIAELLQMPLVIAFVGAAGIAIGRARARLSLSLVIIAGAALFTMFPGYWLWNTPPMHLFTPIQTQPLEIELDAATEIDQLPATWFVRLSSDDEPIRQLVHQPTILGHDLYLFGLTALVVGLAVRATLGRRLAFGGAALAAAGVVTQLLVSPL